MNREYAAALVACAVLLTACATCTSLPLPAAVPMAASGVHAAPAGVPLHVDADSRVAVLEYEAWFGPRAVTFQNVGGGYDSADPHVIAQHVQWRLGLHWTERCRERDFSLQDQVMLLPKNRIVNNQVRNI